MLGKLLLETRELIYIHRQQLVFYIIISQNRLMTVKIFVAIAIITLSIRAAVRDDLVTKVPGYGPEFNTSVYSGYLNTADPSRRLHYLFVESVKGANNSDPLTLWLNGGPGCSSLLGFLQQIGPYYLEEGKNYTIGDQLMRNNFSWYNVSNLLFLQSPAGVGYSINNNKSFEYNDLTTLQDNFEAIKNFFSLYPEYKNAKFWIAGESYAGKYIPDLAFRIDHYNLDPSTSQSNKINFKGVFIGNGVIDFRNNELFKSTVQYFIGHDFLDPDTLAYWRAACTYDQQSAGCQFFYQRMQQTLDDVNPYNIYSYCYYNDSFAMPQGQQKKQFLSQESILMTLARTADGQQQINEMPKKNKFNGAPCAYFDGLYQYFNVHYRDFHADVRYNETNKWNGPCAQDISSKYKIDVSGSYRQIQYLLTRLNDLHLVFYNGDWDGVVPFVDTYKNLEKMKIVQPNFFSPIFYQDQHFGFNMIMAGLHFVIMKGASHQVPQSKRPESFFVFKALLESYPGQPIKFN